MPAPPTNPPSTNNLEDYTSPTTYYSSTDSNNITTIRCPEGYVFEGSNAIFTNEDNDKGVLKYNNSNQWLDLSGNPIPTNPWTSGSFNCVKKYCDPMGIDNSDREYDILVDNDTGDHDRIVCNEGYVFNTANTRSGNVKCGVVPIMRPEDMDKESEMAWYVDNSSYETQCNNAVLGATNPETACEAAVIDYIISEDNDKVYESNDSCIPNIDNADQITIDNCKTNNDETSCNSDNACKWVGNINHIKCTWIPPIPGSSSVQSVFNRNNGKCSFKKRADLNNSEPICKSMYCSKKSIDNSNRIESIDGVLPGPEEGSVHGSCVDFDGQIIDNITNSSDCSCFKHKSCNTCTLTSDCQWCGSNDQGEGGFCYSTKTHLGICNNSIRGDRDGTCTHKQTKKPALPEPSDGWTEDSCEASVCVKKTYWDNLQQGYNETPTDMTNYLTNLNTENACLVNNNRWDPNMTVDDLNKCILTNNVLNPTLGTSMYNYYPKGNSTNTNTPIELNISDHICVPSTSPHDDTTLQTCLNHLDKNSCSSDSDCNWILNPIRDSLFNWSDIKKVIFRGGGTSSTNADSPNCPIHKTTGTNSLDKLEFNILKNDNKITLQNSRYNCSSGSCDAVSSSNDYNRNCALIDVEKYKDVFQDTQCQSLKNTTFSNTIDFCGVGGVKYCTSSTMTKSSPSTLACPPGSTVNINGIDIPGCAYHLTQTLAHTDNPNNNCYGNNVDYECSLLDSASPHNCEKIMGSNDQQNICTDTEYVPSTTPTTIDNISYDNSNFKNYITCDTSFLTDNGLGVNKTRCENIGQDKATYGKFCKRQIDPSVSPSSGSPPPPDVKIPMKQICEKASLSGNYSWEKNKDSISPNSHLDWGCFKNDGSMLSDDAICNLINGKISQTADSGVYVQLDSDISGGIQSWKSTYTASPTPTCDGKNPSEIPSSGLNDTICNEYTKNSYLWTPTTTETCIIDDTTGTPTGTTLNDICTSFINHDIGFQFYPSDTLNTRRGSCVRIDNPSQTPRNVLIKPENLCTTDNNSWISKNDYSNLGSCRSLRDRVDDLPDIPTDWTGGEIRNEDGMHVSECSASIMSSCNVDCDPGYGGGGEWNCQYNSHGKDICNIINNKTSEKQTLCDNEPTCIFDTANNQCTHDPHSSNTTDGHLEWIGSPCYKIDNTAFSHGIADLPDLDIAIKPFYRVSLYIIVNGFLFYLLLKFGINPIIKNILKLFDWFVNLILRGYRFNAGLLDDVVNGNENVSTSVFEYIISVIKKPINILKSLGFLVLIIIIIYSIITIFDKTSDKINPWIESIYERIKNIIKEILSKIMKATVPSTNISPGSPSSGSPSSGSPSSGSPSSGSPSPGSPSSGSPSADTQQTDEEIKQNEINEQNRKKIILFIGIGLSIFSVIMIVFLLIKR